MFTELQSSPQEGSPLLQQMKTSTCLMSQHTGAETRGLCKCKVLGQPVYREP